MPIVLYTNGWRTHVRLKPEVVRALLDCATIVAIKAADPDIADLSDLIALVGDELAISCGWEVHAIHGAALGARSYFGIAGNFNPALEHRYEHALEAMDLGELRQLHAAALAAAPLLLGGRRAGHAEGRAGDGGAGRGPGAAAAVTR